ncbi:MAG: hypothetical protein R2688_04720 [Fimbriimonadaceae bacterium]
MIKRLLVEAFPSGETLNNFDERKEHRDNDEANHEAEEDDEDRFQCGGQRCRVASTSDS